MQTDSNGQPIVNQVGSVNQIPPRSSVGEQVPDSEGKMFYSNTPGSTFIYTDGAIEIFRVGGNLITDKERIRQLTAAADKSAGLIHTREEAPEVMVKPDKLEEARRAILAAHSDRAAAASDPRLAALLAKAAKQSEDNAAQKAAVEKAAPLNPVSTASLANASKDSNSGTNKV